MIIREKKYLIYLLIIIIFCAGCFAYILGCSKKSEKISGWIFEEFGNNGGTSNLIDNGDGTISDSKTGLMWQNAPPDQLFNQMDAVSYCHDLIRANYENWRAPMTCSPKTGPRKSRVIG